MIVQVLSCEVFFTTLDAKILTSKKFHGELASMISVHDFKLLLVINKMKSATFKISYHW